MSESKNRYQSPFEKITALSNEVDRNKAEEADLANLKEGLESLQRIFNSFVEAAKAQVVFEKAIKIVEKMLESSNPEVKRNGEMSFRMIKVALKRINGTDDEVMKPYGNRPDGQGEAAREMFHSGKTDEEVIAADRRQFSDLLYVTCDNIIKGKKMMK